MGVRGQASSDAMVAQRLEVGTRIYELRYNRCGKRNCRVCYHRPVWFCGSPGHGPYWYLCVARGGSWVRLYIGKELDTGKWIGENGAIDWASYRKRGKREAGQ